MATFFGRMGQVSGIAVPAGQRLAVFSNAPVKIDILVDTTNHPDEYTSYATMPATTGGTEYVSGAMAVASVFRLTANFDDAWYEVGVAPAISEPLANQTMAGTPASITGKSAAAGGSLHTVGGTTTGAGAAGGTAGVRGGQPGAGGAGGIGEVVGGAGNDTGAGGVGRVVGGASGGGATGNGGAAQVTGGAAASTDGNGGSVILTPGAKAGGGKVGVVISRGRFLRPQGAPDAETGTATIHAADLLGDIITDTHATGATAVLTLDSGANLDAALPDMAVGDSFDWHLINLSAAAADTDTVTSPGADHTVVGIMIVQSAHATTGGNGSGNVGAFRTRKTAAATYITYRIG